MNNLIKSTDQQRKDTSEYWYNTYYQELTIYDPDGWDRRNYQFSFFEEKITYEEFTRRLFKSTILWEPHSTASGETTGLDID